MFDEIEKEQIELLANGTCPKCQSDDVTFAGDMAWFCDNCDTEWEFEEGDENYEMEIEYD